MFRLTIILRIRDGSLLALEFDGYRTGNKAQRAVFDVSSPHMVVFGFDHERIDTACIATALGNSMAFGAGGDL